ncbi:Uncharacterized mitochondrial protein AtMg00310 [Linum grandiflorum]
MMKAKYHTHSFALDTVVGYRPSFIWRSLMSAQEFLWKGLRWRIGNGTSVHIWGDWWVPTITDNFIPSPPIELPVDGTVRELFDPDNDNWNSALIEYCFPTAIVDAILQIPIRDLEENDRLIWRHSKDGSYTTRSGYLTWLDDFMM